MNLNKNIKYGLIYKFTSPSNKIYIGQSIEFSNRLKKYKRNKGSINKLMSKAINKYKSIDNFKLDILYYFEYTNEDIEIIKNKLNILEKKYIEKYNSFGLKGYNLTAGGRGSFKRVVSDETRKKLSESNKGIGVIENKKLICPICKKTFYLKPCIYRRRIKISKYKKIYCSKQCNSDGQKKLT